MERAGIAPNRTATIKGFTPVGGADRATLYGESLPPGLVLGTCPGLKATIGSKPPQFSKLVHAVGE